LLLNIVNRWFLNLGLTEWYAARRKENIYDMRSRTVSRTTFSSQTFVNFLVEYRLSTQSFWPIDMQRRKNGTQLKVLPF